MRGADLSGADLTDSLRSPPPLVYIDDEPLHEYASGSAGPEAADELIAPRKWRGL